MAFPDDPLLQVTELALGADITGDPALWSWTDVSDYVQTADGARIKVVRGRRNDSGKIPPATAELQLDNTDGRFCTDYPMSPYYPLLQVNTPMRVTVSADSGSSWSRRFSGFLGRLPTTYRGPGGSDAFVSVTAQSVKRRLEQPPGRSPLRWTAPALPTSGRCLEYWPIEDDESATAAVSYFPTGVAMTATGSLELGRSSPPTGSNATAQSDYEFMYANPPSLTGIVRPYTATTAWTILGIFKTDAESVLDQVLFDCDINHGEGSTDPDQIRLHLDGDTISLSAYQEDTTLLGSYPGSAQTTAPNDGEWHAIAITAAQSGTDIDIDFRYEGSTFGFTVSNRTLGTIRKIAFPSTFIAAEADLLAVGHLTVYDAELSSTAIDTYAAAMRSHLTDAGERVDERLSRLTDETDLVHSITTVAAETGMYERLGGQSKANSLAILEDAVEADGGMLYEPRDFADGSLQYRSRSSLNAAAIAAPVLTLTQDDVSELNPSTDDHYLSTDVTVSGAGSTARATLDPVENETSHSANVRYPDRLPDMASWALYQGTRRDSRFPQIPIKLHAATGLIAAWQDADLGDRVLCPTPPPGVVNDIDLLLEGYTETISQRTWDVNLNCSPASRYQIAKLDDTTYGRMDTASSRLVNAVTSSATSLDVETVEGPEWTTTAGFDLVVGGERMTVSGITGSFSDSFTRTVAAGWGTSTSGHAWSLADGVAADYAVNGTRGTISIGSVNALRSMYINDLDAANIDRTITARIPALATGAAILVRQAARWDVSANTYLALALQAETTQAVTAQLIRVVAGSVTTLMSKTVPGLTHTTGTDFRMRFKLDGPRLYGKVWSGTEPTQWTVAAYDAQVTGADAWGVRTRVNTGNTNVLPIAVQFDNDAVATPQRFTVGRSENPVVKPHAAGTGVGLFTQNHLGL